MCLFCDKVHSHWKPGGKDAIFFVRFLGFFHVFQHAQVCVSGNVQPPVYDEGWWLCVSWVISMCFFSQHDHVCVSLNVHLPVVYDEGWWRNWQLSGQRQEEGRWPEIELDPTPVRLGKSFRYKI